jgi:DNA polymerase IIIc chi subunit
MAVQKTDEFEKMVEIKLPRYRDDDANADVVVYVNERSWQIKRGELVRVPECVAEVLRNQERALDRAANYKNSVKIG